MIKLTQEQKRVKIAEACGWKPVYDFGTSRVFMFKADKAAGYIRNLNGEASTTNGSIANVDELPDYFNDLNACHEMEKAIPEDLLEEYQFMVDRLACGDPPDAYRHWSMGLSEAISAPPNIRAEAFGLTLNLWTADQ